MGTLIATKPNLKELRINKGWTQEQVANRVKISRTHYVSVESGKRRPSVGTAQKLGECLGFNWQDLFSVDKTNILHTGDKKQ